MKYRLFNGIGKGLFPRAAAAALALCFLLASCRATEREGGASGASTGTTASASGSSTVGVTPVATVDVSGEDSVTAWEEAGSTTVTAQNGAVEIKGDGAKEQAGAIVLSAGGTYVFSGAFDGVGIVVNGTSDKTVRIVLNNASVTASKGPAIYVERAEKVIVTSAAGTQNSLTDGSDYTGFVTEESGEPDAALFSKSDLTVNGDGALTIKGGYSRAIVCKDDLLLYGVNLSVAAVGDGIQGRDSATVKDSTVTIAAGADGLRSTNGEEAEKGKVTLDNSTVTITSGEDGIQAETLLTVLSGTVAVTAGGGDGQKASDDASHKGLKGVSALIVNGGTIRVSSSDDALHSNGSVTINGGVLELSTGDDGIHADEALTINGGDITVAKSYEGLESKVITQNDGTVHVTASDDGVNVAGGKDGSSMDGPGRNDFENNEGYLLTISGGYLSVNAGGDGLDSNGSVVMTGGVVLVNGPTDNGNGAIDYNGSFTISGGTLIAAGSAGMAQTPGGDSPQNSVIIGFNQTQQGGTMVRIAGSAGETIATFVPEKEFQTIVVSVPSLERDKTYTVYTGGSVSGVVTDGYYDGSDYSGGTEYTTFTVTQGVTEVNFTGGMGGGIGGGMGGGNRGDRGRP